MLEIKHLSKQYRKKQALNTLSLTINKGVLGLLGPNGAGKSTLLKLIATIDKPTDGHIMLNRNNIVKDPDYMRKQLGFLPQDFGVYPNLNAFEFLEYIAALKGVGGKNLKQRIHQLLEGVNLLEHAHKPIGTYSGGMRQRVGIAQTLLNDPNVIIFDEPTVGLDPEERVRFRDLIADLAQERIVILSSHIVSDIDSIAGTVAIMKDGQLVITGPQSELLSTVNGCVYESVITPEELHTFNQRYPVVSSIRRSDGLHVRYLTKTPVNGAIRKEPNLEDVYIRSIKQHAL